MLAMVLRPAGLVAVISEAFPVGLHSGDKVLRLRPENEQHLQYLKNVSQTEQVDFWIPTWVELVTINSSVDVRVPGEWVSEVLSQLEKTALKYEVLNEKLQILIADQLDQKSSEETYSYENYHNWEQIEAWTSKIAEENPRLISRFEIGKSYEGRSIYLLRVGKRTGVLKPSIFLECGIHAREWISPAFCQWFVKEAVASDKTGSLLNRLINELDFLVVPVVNVDGYAYTWTNNRFWRKTRSRNPGTNCVGTDANRNFDAKWCTNGSSTHPCSNVYCGPYMESEKEVKAIADFVRSHRKLIKGYISIHSYSQLLMFPYGYNYSLSADHEELNALARNAVAKLRSLHGTDYKYGTSARTIYIAAGTSDDWAYDLGIKYTFIFELRDTGTHGFLLPESLIKETCEETMLAINHIAAYVLNHPY
ncbi:carboxypeptidase B-like [Pristis pectinata]|uniref:carboxypeptidase B-like n=1 Tax=Pristis pectinata TaxID=685728 RepID=UPI00223E3D42|nr:carboxypeptidase B-like [Pristis pectinata]